MSIKYNYLFKIIITLKTQPVTIVNVNVCYYHMSTFGTALNCVLVSCVRRGSSSSSSTEGKCT